VLIELSSFVREVSRSFLRFPSFSDVSHTFATCGEITPTMDSSSWGVILDMRVSACEDMSISQRRKAAALIAEHRVAEVPLS